MPPEIVVLIIPSLNPKQLTGSIDSKISIFCGGGEIVNGPAEWLHPKLSVIIRLYMSDSKLLMSSLEDE